MDGDGVEVTVVVAVNIMLQLFLLWIKMFELLLLVLGVSMAKKLFLLRIKLLLLLLYCNWDVCIKTWFINLLVPSRDDGLSWDILKWEEKKCFGSIKSFSHQKKKSFTKGDLEKVFFSFPLAMEFFLFVSNQYWASLQAFSTIFVLKLTLTWMRVSKWLKGIQERIYGTTHLDTSCGMGNHFKLWWQRIKSRNTSLNL